MDQGCVLHVNLDNNHSLMAKTTDLSPQGLRYNGRKTPFLVLWSAARPKRPGREFFTARERKKLDVPEDDWWSDIASISELVA